MLAAKDIMWIIWKKMMIDATTIPTLNLVLQHIEKVRMGLPVMDMARQGSMIMAPPEVVRDTQIFLTIAPKVVDIKQSEMYEYNKLLDEMENEIKGNIEGMLSVERMPRVYHYFNKLYKFLEMGNI